MITTPSATFTRPADTTQYTAADLIANSTTAASVAPMEFGVSRVGGRGIIRRVRLYKSTATATLASFNVHLFTSSPGTPTNGDNGALALASAAGYIGEVAVDMSSGGSPGTVGLFKASAAVEIMFALPALDNRIYGLLEAIGGYTPAESESFTVTLEIEGE